MRTNINATVVNNVCADQFDRVIVAGVEPFRALILSQVVLSIQLPLTIVPLLVLSRRQGVMGAMRLRGLGVATGWLVAAIIIGLNGFLLYQTFLSGGV